LDALGIHWGALVLQVLELGGVVHESLDSLGLGGMSLRFGVHGWIRFGWRI
jgi:hypothetical protein